MSARSGRVAEIEHIDIGAIEVGYRLRRLDQERVAALVSSIREIGLQTPITVYAVQHDDAFTHRLVAGQHRLEAIKALRWNQIDCFVTTATESDLKLWEIDENLVRSDLIEIERAEHLKRRKEIFDARANEKTGGESLPTSLKDGRKAGPQHGKGFAQDTAEKTGLSKSSINKSLRRAEKIDSQVQKAITGTPIATKGVELDALADMSPEEQARAVAMVESGKAGSVREARESIAPLSGMHTEPPLNLDERASRWCKFKDALECLNRMPNAETFANTVPAAQRVMVTWKLPIARTWLDNFQAEWTERWTGASRNNQDKRAITRAWDQISDDCRRAFVAKLKEEGWFDDPPPAQALAESRTDEPDIPAALDRRADNGARAT